MVSCWDRRPVQPAPELYPAFPAVPVSARPNPKSLVVVAVEGEAQVVEAMLWLATAPHTSTVTPLAGMPEYSATIVRDGWLGVTLIPVMPLGAFARWYTVSRRLAANPWS